MSISLIAIWSFSVLMNNLMQLYLFILCDDAYDLKRKSRRLKNASNHLDNAENRIRVNFIYLAVHKISFQKEISR